MKRRAASLVELLVCTVILGIAAGPIVAATAWMSYQTAHVERRALALAAIQSQYATVRGRFATNAISTGVSTRTTTMPGNVTLTITTNITVLLGQYTVQLTATWSERGLDGQERNVRLAYTTILNTSNV